MDVVAITMSVTGIFEQEIRAKFSDANMKNFAIKLIRAVTTTDLKEIIDGFVDEING